MLQAFRDNLKGTMAIIIVGLMIIPFALFGVDSLFLQDNSAGKAAEVNGTAISEFDLNRAVQVQKQQLLDRFGDQAPADLLSDERLRGPVLERLIDRELLRQAAEDGGMAVSDAALDQLILSTGQFQRDGKFSGELYTQLLRNMGYTPSTYKSLLTEDILVNQLAGGLSESAFATSKELEFLTALTQQERSFLYLTVPASTVADEIEITDGQLQAHYESNAATYTTEEQVSVEYIELNLEALADGIDVSDNAITQQFEQELAAFTPVTQRHAAHILIESDNGEAEKIATVQQQLAEGGDFAELAKQYSDDLGSSEFGGDLGTTDGATFPPEFEQALAELSVGQVSDPVQTDSGYHFIKLVDEVTTQPPTLVQSRDRIAEELAMAEADSVYVELLEQLPDLSYNAESLADVGEELGLEVQESELFDRMGGVGVLANNQVLAAAFSSDLLNDGLASDLIELSDNHVVVIKVKEHRPATLQPLADVEAQVREAVTANNTRDALQASAQTIISNLQSGQKLQTVAEEKGYQWQAKAEVQRNDIDVDRAILEHVFSLPKPNGNPVYSALPLADGDYAVVQLTVVDSGSMPELEAEQVAALQRRLAQQAGGNEFTAFQVGLTNSSDIDIFE